jgi:hypothetical protein
MSTSTWILIGIAIVILLIVVGLLVARQRKDKTEQLRERFGPEYDRAVEEQGRERDAQKHLADVAERRDSLDIRPLEPASRERYLRRWDVVQSEFVDRPGPAVDEADALVNDVMRERGYPVDDFDTRAEMVAADHPHVVEDYRHATDARRRYLDAGDTASTEELRRAMVHYRSLFERLVGGNEARADSADGGDGGQMTSGRHAE